MHPAKNDNLPHYIKLTDYHKKDASHYHDEQVTAAIERYSASVEEQDTVCCFLVFHDTGENLRSTRRPLNDCRVRGQFAKSESHLPCNKKILVEEYLDPDFSLNKAQHVGLQSSVLPLDSA